MPKSSQHAAVEKKYELGTLLGTGAFSEVFQAKRRSSGEAFAIKVINKKQVDSKDGTLENEIRILEQLQHPNIVQLIEIVDTKNFLYLVMELVSGGELFDQVVSLGSYTEKRASDIVRQILDAVNYLHGKGIVHRDLKPENILFFSKREDSKVLISDFGLSKLPEGELMKTACGTPGYVAPEILKQQKYDRRVDCWSIGVISYILLCGYPPFYSESDPILFQQIKKGEYEFESPYWDDISVSAKDFVKKLMTVSPAARMTCPEALAHPWIAGGAPSTDISKSVKQQLKEQRWKRLKGFARVVGRLRTLSVDSRTGRSRSPSPNPLQAAAAARERAQQRREGEAAGSQSATNPHRQGATAL